MIFCMFSLSSQLFVHFRGLKVAKNCQVVKNLILCFFWVNFEVFSLFFGDFGRVKGSDEKRKGLKGLKTLRPLAKKDFLHMAGSLSELLTGVSENSKSSDFTIMLQLYDKPIIIKLVLLRCYHHFDEHMPLLSSLFVWIPKWHVSFSIIYWL